MSDILSELQWRGLVAQHTDITQLQKALAETTVTFYCGFDPTAPSLHHGHLVQLILMRHLQMAGHRPIALVGGATGMIGDPRMSGERTLNPREVVGQWTERLHRQIAPFLSFTGENAARVVNNLDWIGSLSAIDLLRDVGQYFRLGQMIAKDNVARRLASEEGISYTEFSYQILQGYDFLMLYRQFGCAMQTGGNDQWGNLVSGMDLIRKAEGATAHVLTTPLITKADGTKFGKSEGGAIWLDPEMFSPYQFYQFWLNVEDADVVRFLKIFTFLSREEIAQLADEAASRPHLRLAQRRLAAEVTDLVHGQTARQGVEAASAAIFGNEDFRALDERTLLEAVEPLPQGEGELGVSTIVDMLLATGLETGRSAARRTVSSGGAYLNNQKVTDEDAPVTVADLLPGGIVVIRKGRKNPAVVRFSADK